MVTNVFLVFSLEFSKVGYIGFLWLSLSIISVVITEWGPPSFLNSLHCVLHTFVL